MIIETILLIKILVLVSTANSPKCKQVEKNIYNVHGRILKISIPTEITICDPDMVVKQLPIQLIEYTDYFKIKSKHPRFRKREDRLPTLYSGTFSLLSNIKTLDLSQLELECIESRSFRNLTNLRYLNLYDNKLKTLPGDVLDDVPNLVELNVNNNQLESLESNQFAKLTSLETLRLSNNNLKDLPEYLFKFQNKVKYLSLTGNSFSSLRSNLFQGLENLLELKLLKNVLGVVQEDALLGLQNLEHLALEYNQMIIFFDIEREFRSIPALRRLSLSPEDFECSDFRKITKISQRNNVELVQLSKSEHEENCSSVESDTKYA